MNKFDQNKANCDPTPPLLPPLASWPLPHSAHAPFNCSLPNAMCFRLSSQAGRWCGIPHWGGQRGSDGARHAAQGHLSQVS